MKHLFCILLFTCAFLTNSWGQLDNYSKDFKIGSAYFPNYDGSSFTEAGLYAEFTKSFVDQMNIGLGIRYSTGFVSLLDEEARLNTVMGDITLYYSVLKNLRIRHDLRVGGNIAAMYQHNALNDDPTSLTPGFGPIINYDIMLVGNWMLGLRGVANFFEKRSPIYMLGLHVGYKLK